MAQIFSEVSLILIVATCVSALARIFKLPIVLAYILTGVLIGPTAFSLISNNEILSLFSQIGVSLLLFIVGLNLSPKVIKDVGKVAFLAGSGQIIFTFLAGYFLSILLGFSNTESIIIGIGLTFSSTIIVLKLLSDKKELETLHGKISTGILLIQDLIAMFILMFAPTLSGAGNTKGILIQTLVVGLFLTSVLIL